MTETTTRRFPEATAYAEALQAALRARAGDFGFLAKHPVSVVASGYNRVDVLHEDGHLATGTPVYAVEDVPAVAAAIYQNIQMTISPSHANGLPMTFSQSLHPSAQR